MAVAGGITVPLFVRVSLLLVYGLKPSCNYTIKATSITLMFRFCQVRKIPFPFAQTLESLRQPHLHHLPLSYLRGQLAHNLSVTATSIQSPQGWIAPNLALLRGACLICH